MLGAAQTDALRAETAGTLRIVRVVAVRPDFEPAETVCPAQQLLQLAGHLRVEHGHLPGDDAPGAAVDGEGLTFLDGLAAGGEPALGEVDMHRLCAGNAWLAHAAGDHRGMRRAAAA